jgi:hypothetical protein
LADLGWVLDPSCLGERALTSLALNEANQVLSPDFFDSSHLAIE